jgi:hypothetical protein
MSPSPVGRDIPHAWEVSDNKQSDAEAHVQELYITENFGPTLLYPYKYLGSAEKFS